MKNHEIGRPDLLTSAFEYAQPLMPRAAAAVLGALVIASGPGIEDNAIAANPEDAPTRVAVIDSGFNRQTPNLVPGWNVTTNAPLTSIQDGHGSRMTAYVAKAMKGDSATRAICRSCEIDPIEIPYNTDGVTKGVNAAIERGAKVINLSVDFNIADPPGAAFLIASSNSTE